MSQRKLSCRGFVWRRTGFTLVELLVVIGVIAVLVAMLLPALNKARRQAVALSCLSNERQIATAMIMYANDNGGAMPGIEYQGGYAGITYPYDNRPFVGQVIINSYPKQLAGQPGTGNPAWYSNLGLLCYTRYLHWSAMLFCPGRSSDDSLSWDTAALGGLQFSSMGTSGGWNPGWYIWSGTGSCNTMAGYLTATSNRSSDRVVDFGKSHRLGKCASDTPLVLDVFWYGEGATQENHGRGYNIARFDGSAEWYIDPGYYKSHTYQDDKPDWPVELTFVGIQGQSDPGLPLGNVAGTQGYGFPAVASGAQTGTQWWQTWRGTSALSGSRWVAYWGPSGANTTPYDNINATSGIPFIEKYLMGWNDYKIYKNTPK